MGRKPIAEEKVQQITSMLDRGYPEEEIAKAAGVSKGTVGNYKKAHRPPPSPSPPQTDELPDADVSLEGVSMSQLDTWIARVEAMSKEAELAKDFVRMGGLMRTALALVEHKRKALPPPPPNHDENPDMIAAAKRARELLHQLVETAVGKP